MSEDRKNWRIEFLGERGWCIVDRWAADLAEAWATEDEKKALAGRVPGLVAHSFPSREAAQATIDDITALFWSHIRALLACSDPRKGELIALEFEDRMSPEMASKVREEAWADDEKRTVLEAALEHSPEGADAFSHWLKLSTPEARAREERAAHDSDLPF